MSASGLTSEVPARKSEVRLALNNGHCQPDLSGRKSAMCGRLRVGKRFLHVAGLVSAAMCSAIKANANGAKLEPVLETIENALRADQAKTIEAEG